MCLLVNKAVLNFFFLVYTMVSFNQGKALSNTLKFYMVAPTTFPVPSSRRSQVLIFTAGVQIGSWYLPSAWESSARYTSPSKCPMNEDDRKINSENNKVQICSAFSYTAFFLIYKLTCTFLASSFRVKKEWRLRQIRTAFPNQKSAPTQIPIRS